MGRVPSDVQVSDEHYRPSGRARVATMETKVQGYSFSNLMSGKRIKITKRRIRLREFVESMEAVFRRVSDWLGKQSKQQQTNPDTNRVIRIRKGGTTALPSSLPTTAAREYALRITSPLNGAEVSERPLVEGYVANLESEIWVVIHPLEVSDYWVQPAVSVRQEGTWKVRVYVGRPGILDVGKGFEIMACANPHQQMREGLILNCWPRAKWTSNVVEVVRFLDDQTPS